jgi:hypothetical protein
MRQLAANTDGLAMMTRSRLKARSPRIAADMNGYDVVTYRSTNNRWTGSSGPLPSARPSRRRHQDPTWVSRRQRRRRAWPWNIDGGRSDVCIRCGGDKRARELQNQNCACADG